MNVISRRKVLVCVAMATLFPNAIHAQTASPKIVVAKDPSCSCCGSWVKYLRSSGFSAEIIETAEVERIKKDLGVPQSLWSCHTAEIDGYTIEGHVPADVIQRLLKERPHATGIAVAGMPSSAPGMDVPGASDAYDVTLFGAFGQRRYARFQGLREISG
jgi:hypothetical protein